MAQLKVNAMSQGHMVRMLIDGASVNEIAKSTGLGRQTVCEYVKALYKAGAIRIDAWQQDFRGRTNVRVYTIGTEPDAERPPPKPNKEVKAEYRKRQRDAKLLGIKS